MFVISALSEITKSEQEAPTHNTRKIKELLDVQNVLIVFREPSKAIAAWHEYRIDHQNKKELDQDIDFFIRFYSFAIANKDEITFLDFDKFTSNIGYLFEKLSFNLDTEVTYDLIAAKMETVGLSINHLPNKDRYKNRALLEKKIKAHKKHQELINLYAELKKLDSGI